MAWSRSAAAKRILHDRRLERRLTDKFKLLIATPETLTGAVAPATSSALTLPANTMLGASYSAVLGANELRFNTSTSRIIGTPALAIGQIVELGFFEEAVTIDAEVTVAVAGTVTLYHLDNRRKPFAIATATFT